jgi:DNA-directed RNA polymerase specialized sigma24 family protein
VRVANRDDGAFELLMRQRNGRLFRIARAILKDDAEAEDVLQETCLDVTFAHTVTSAARGFDSREIAAGQSWTVQPPRPESSPISARSIRR